MDHTNTDAFWDRSWGSIDPEYLSSNLGLFDTTEDVISDFLRKRKISHVCDAGCGCGIYSLKMAQDGLSVSGFDIAEKAVLLTKKLLSENGFPTEDFKQGNILSTGYPDSRFDAAVAKDVVDHMPIKQGMLAVAELLRIVRPGGYVLLTLDAADDEYEDQPHEINEDGDYLYIRGKWEGMVFHPYSISEVTKLSAGYDCKHVLQNEKGVVVIFEK